MGPFPFVKGKGGEGPSRPWWRDIFSPDWTGVGGSRMVDTSWRSLLNCPLVGGGEDSRRRRRDGFRASLCGAGLLPVLTGDTGGSGGSCGEPACKSLGSTGRVGEEARLGDSGRTVGIGTESCTRREPGRRL